LLSNTESSMAQNKTNKNPAKTGIVEGSYFVTFKTAEKGQESFIKRPEKVMRGFSNVPFGMHSTGQSKHEIALDLNLNGEVVAIYDAINTIHVKMDEKEADRLSRNTNVESITPNQYMQISATQTGVEWALDLMDETTITLDSTYNYSFDGAGRTVYVLDSGLDLGVQAVADEFDGRAQVFWDVNDQGGNDCFGHGTQVASAIAGETYGIAKGANLIIAKITEGCTDGGLVDTSILAFNWLATNAPAGTIVNYSNGLQNPGLACSPSLINPVLEAAVRAAHNAGIMIVVAAGNDGCNTNDFSPANIPESFVVGSTGAVANINGQNFLVPNRRSPFSRVGNNISGFSPGFQVEMMDWDGTVINNFGTSFSAPYVTGVFAVGCQAAGTLCDTGDTAPVYQALRDLSPTGTIFDTNGTPMVGTASRFIAQQW